MEALFLRFFNMGLTGSAVILAVCLARLALRRAPKAMACACPRSRACTMASTALAP